VGEKGSTTRDRVEDGVPQPPRAPLLEPIGVPVRERSSATAETPCGALLYSASIKTSSLPKVTFIFLNLPSFSFLSPARPIVSARKVSFPNFVDICLKSSRYGIGREDVGEPTASISGCGVPALVQAGVRRFELQGSA